MLFSWMLAMILIVFLPLYMWKSGLLQTNRDFVFVLVGFGSIGIVSLIGILSGY